MKKEKVLICVLAQARAAKLTWLNFKTNVLKNLNADLALCVSKDSKLKKNNPYYLNAKYIWECKNYKEFSPAFDLVQKYYLGKKTKLPNWRKLKKIKDYWLGGIKDSFGKTSPSKRGSAAILIFFRWFLLKSLEENNLINKYDRFIITRSDFLWIIKHPKLKYLNKKYFWIPYGEFYGGITDRFAVLSKENIVDYLNIIEPIILNPRNLFNKMRNHNKWNLEKYILFNFKLKKKNNLIRFFPYISYTVRDKYTDTTLAKGNLIQGTKIYIKYVREYLSSSIFGLIIDNESKWKNIKLLLIFFRFIKFFMRAKLIRNIIYSKIKKKFQSFDSEITESYFKKN